MKKACLTPVTSPEYYSPKFPDSNGNRLQLPIVKKTARSISFALIDSHQKFQGVPYPTKPLTIRHRTELQYALCNRYRYNAFATFSDQLIKSNKWIQLLDNSESGT
jgi:hypothetical protein